MQDFALYFQIGSAHILDWQAYDHLLFLLALCASYLLSDWKKVLLLITAFTIGHSITLALSVINWIHFPSAWIELLIPISIAFTAVSNLMDRSTQKWHRLASYLITLFFGLIHGLGFSNYLKSLLGTEISILQPLLAFNLGLEFGQIIIVITILALAQVLVSQLKLPQKTWILLLSILSVGLATKMIIERFPAIL